MEVFSHPAFVTDKPLSQSHSQRSSSFNGKFLIDESASRVAQIVKKQEVNDAFQIPSNQTVGPPIDETTKKNDFFNELANDSIIENSLKNSPTPVKDVRIQAVPVKKSLSVPLPSYIPMFLAGYYKGFVRSRKKKFEKIKVKFGPNVQQDTIYNHKNNYISTTKYQKL